MESLKRYANYASIKILFLTLSSLILFNSCSSTDTVKFIAKGITPTDGNAEELRKAHDIKGLSIIQQDLLFDFTDSLIIYCESSVEVHANEDGAQLVAFALGPMKSVELIEPIKQVEFLKTPGEIGHSSLLGVRFLAPFKKGEERIFRIKFSYAQNDELSPALGLYLPLQIHDEKDVFSGTIIFKTADNYSGQFLEGELVSFKQDGKTNIFKWKFPALSYPHCTISDKRMFHKEVKTINFYLTCGEESKNNGDAGLKLVSDVYFFLVELYGKLPNNTLSVYECEREEGTVRNLGGVIEMKKNEFTRLNDPWLAGALCHEIAHEWWGRQTYGKEGETDFSEGFAEFSFFYYTEKTRGVKPLKEIIEEYTNLYLEGTKMPIIKRTDELITKYPIIMRNLLYVMGEDKFFKMARLIIERYRGKSVSNAMFQNACEEVSGQSLDWFFENLFRSSNDLDFEIQNPQQTHEESHFVIRFEIYEKLGKFEYQGLVPVSMRTKNGQIINKTYRPKEPIVLNTDEEMAEIEIDSDFYIWDIDRTNTEYKFPD